MPLDGLKFGRYLLERRIGRGGMGEVYRAKDTHIGRNVAIKVIEIEDDSAASQEDLSLFQREMEAIGALNHPHTLPLYDYGETASKEEHFKYIYMVMPLCQEDTLATWRQRYPGSKVFSPTDVVHFISQAASALQDAHDHGVVHRDVKPQNFLIRLNKEKSNLPDLLLADFGIAKFMTATHNTSGQLRGTPSYMAPEQWSITPVEKSQQVKIDQYALAIMAYDLLVGQMPFQGDVPRLIHMHTSVLPKSPSALNPEVPTAVDAVILRALAKRPEERYPSVEAFAEALKKAVYSGKKGEDVHMILAISETEAVVGTERSLTPHGMQPLEIRVPADTKNSDVLSLEGKGKAAPYGGPPGTLYITISTRSDVSTEEIISKQLHHLNTKLSVLKTHDASSTQRILAHLQSIDRDMTVLQQSNHVAPQMTISSPGKTITAMAVIVIVIILIASSALYSFMTMNQQSVVATTLQSIATATSIVQISGTAQAFKSATATALSEQSIATATSIVQIRGTAQAFKSATATALSENPYPPYFPGRGNLAMLDSLSATSSNQWDTNEKCMFASGAYRITSSSSLNPCFAHAAYFSNFAIQVRFTIIYGSENCGGIIFRADSTGTTYSYFELCEDGYYRLNQNSEDHNPAISVNTGLNQYNVISIVADHNNVIAYINGKKVGIISNSSFMIGGNIGLLADTYSSQSVEVAFSNLQVWTLS